MINRFLFMVLPLLLLTSCGSEDSTVVPSPSTNTPIVAASSTSTHTPSATRGTITTPTSLLETMRSQCLEITNEPPADEHLKGVILYNGDFNLFSFLSNQETNDTYLFPREEGDTLWQFGVSPDGKYVKYIHSSLRTNEDWLVVATADGKLRWSQLINSFDWEWFDNERLSHIEFSEDGTRTFSLLNPFTGIRQNLMADFPDSELFNGEWFPNWDVLQIYDPTLTRVVYPITGSTEKKEWPITLLNTETNQVVTWIVTTDGWGGTPLWTPDGQHLILATSTDPYYLDFPSKEFFIVSRNGFVKQITHFADYFHKVEIFNNYSLSPNGKLVAFWSLTEPRSLDGPSLAVLNIKTGTITDYCIQGDPFADNAMQPSRPVWSPDSSQLLVISRVSTDTKVRRVVVVDTVNNYAAQINQDVEPVGWMLAP